MIRRALLVLSLAAAAVVGFYAIVIVASESDEVVILRSRDAEGRVHTSRLWLVDHDDAEWVRTGSAEKQWFQRIEADSSVELERGGATSTRTAVVVRDPATAQAVNEAFARKYGAADWIVALSGDASKRVVVRLDRPHS